MMVDVKTTEFSIQIRLQANNNNDDDDDDDEEEDHNNNTRIYIAPFP